MKNVSLFVVLLICIGSAQGQWQLAGFAGRNVECIAQHPQDTSIVLTAVADSLFQSTDGGNSWSFLVHFSGLPVNCLMYDPMYNDTVYALLGNGSFSDGIYCSTDGGYNWAVLEWFLRPRCMVIPGYPQFLMLVGCDSSGIFKTEDGGSTWQAWNNGLTNLNIHALDYCMPFDSVPIFYAGTAHGLFRKTVDGWVQVNGAPTDLVVSCISYHRNQAIGFASFTGGSWSDGIYRSTDYGINWQVVDWWIYSSCVVLNPLWQNYPEDTCGIFAGDSGLGIKYSDDCGNTWQEVNSGLGNAFVNALFYHPVDSMRLFAATQGGLYRYQYGPGIVENRVEEGNALGMRVPSIVRVGANIRFEYSMQNNENVLPLRLLIYDAIGRLERVELLDHLSTVLKPIDQTGVYFLRVGDGTDQSDKKIIVID